MSPRIGAHQTSNLAHGHSEPATSMMKHVTDGPCYATGSDPMSFHAETQ